MPINRRLVKAIVDTHKMEYSATFKKMRQFYLQILTWNDFQGYKVK